MKKFSGGKERREINFVSGMSDANDYKEKRRNNMKRENRKNYSTPPKIEEPTISRKKIRRKKKTITILSHVSYE